jgi:hypothetical protein
MSSRSWNRLAKEPMGISFITLVSSFNPWVCFPFWFSSESVLTSGRSSFLLIACTFVGVLFYLGSSSRMLGCGMGVRLWAFSI